MRVWFPLVMGGLLLTTAYADHKPPTPADKYWSGSANLGFVANTGNTRSKNLSSKLALEYDRERWTNSLDLTAQIGSSNRAQSVAKYGASYETNYSFTQRNFLFGRVSGNTDKFGPFHYTLSTSVGYGRRIFETHRSSIDVQAGPGFKQLRESSTGIVRRQPILYLAGTYNWDISADTNFRQKVNVSYGRTNTEALSSTALTTKVIGGLGLQVSFDMDYNTYIPPDSSNDIRLDTTTNVALVYSF